MIFNMRSPQILNNFFLKNVFNPFLPEMIIYDNFYTYNENKLNDL